MKFKGGSKFSEELEKLITKAHGVLNEDKKNLIINSHDKKFVESMDTTNFFESLENVNDITTVQELYNRLILELKPSILIDFLLSKLGKIPCGRVRGLYNVVEKYLIIGWLELVKQKFPDSNDYKYTGLGASWIRNILRPTFREMFIDNEIAKSVYGRTRKLCISEETYLRDVEVYKDENCINAQKNYVTDKDKFLREYSLDDSCPNQEMIIEKIGLKNIPNDDDKWLKLVDSALRANVNVTTEALLTYCDNAEELGIILEEEEEKRCEEIEMKKMPSDETLDKGMKVTYRGQEFTIESVPNDKSTIESVPNDKFIIVNLNGTRYNVNAKQIKKIQSIGGKSIKLNKRNKKSKKHIKKSNNKKYSIKQHYKKKSNNKKYSIKQHYKK
jgi:hypothetical protein